MATFEKQILSAESGVRVSVTGRPRTKGSLKPTHIKLGRGQCKVGLREDGEFSVPWKRRMMAAIRSQVECARYASPVEVHSFARFEREEQTEGVVLDSWPTGHQYGDEDKLRRNLLDALTQSALLADDALVVGGQNWKRWVSIDGEPPGIDFVVLPARSLAEMMINERFMLNVAQIR